MLIRRVELKNVKSYVNEVVDFRPGTNAIIGENGVGKTTILEAIGFALFDYLPYKQQDFIREGEKSATVVVHFISPRDEREYQIVRQFGSRTQYYIYDPELEGKLTQSKEDTIAWLCEHLNLEPTVDLRALFRDAIGVPQGLLTAAFLQTPAQRKPIFDPLLRVDEYEKSWQQLRGTERRLEEMANDLAKQEAGLKERLRDLPEIEKRARELERAIHDGQRRFEALEKECNAVTAERKSLERLKEELDQLRAKQRELSAHIQGLENRLKDAKDQVAESENAAKMVETNRAGYEAYLAAERRLKQLEENRAARDDLRQKRSELEKSLVGVTQRIKTLEEDLQKVAQAEEQMAQLAPQVEQQKKLEKELESARVQVIRLETTRHDLEREKEILRDLINQLEEAEKGLAHAVEVKSELAEARQHLQNFETHLEKERELRARLDAEIQKINEQSERLSSAEGAQCPICEGPLTSEHRQRLLIRNRKRVADLKIERGRIESTTRELEARRDECRERIEILERELGGLPTKEQRDALHTHLADQEKRVHEVETEYQSLIEAPNRVQGLERALEAMGNPRQEYQQLQGLIADKSAKQAELDQKRVQRTALQREHEKILAELNAYADLDQQLATTQRERDEHSPAHQTYLENFKVAELLEQRRARAADIEDELQNARREHEEVASQVRETEVRYDPDRYAQARAQEERLRAEQAELRGRIEEQHRQLHETLEQIEALHRDREKLKKIQYELAETEDLHNLITKIRDLLKEAGPLITRLLVESISYQAANLFAEIMNDYTRHLRWNSDYGITLEVNGRDRSFEQLSGGEQMAAALAVRLALLRELSSIDVAFFDEPTSNLDENRRNNLADQILNVKGFSQIFVISHDDTFERAVGNYVRVTKENGISHIESE